MEGDNRFLTLLREIWEKELFTLGDDNEFMVKTVTILLVSLFLLSFLTSRFRNLLINKVFLRYKVDKGVAVSIATITRYIIVSIGFIIIFQASGIDLSALGILLGALGIGIGFGLQNITNNFISGIIILFERPVKVGDRIEVDDVTGDIIIIAARATTILTNDNIAIVVPNADLINSKVINWSLTDRNVRFNFPVRVSYKEDPVNIKRVLMEVAYENAGVLKSPPPDVLFDSYGDSSLDFVLRVWTSKYSNKPNVLKSQLYYSIFEKFKEHGVEVPYPQRDLHLRSGFEGVITSGHQ